MSKTTPNYRRIEQVGAVTFTPHDELQVWVNEVGADATRVIELVRVHDGVEKARIGCQLGKPLADLRELLIEAEARAIVGTGPAATH